MAQCLVGWLGFNGVFNTDLVTLRQYRTNVHSKLHSIMGNTTEYNTNQRETDRIQ